MGPLERKHVTALWYERIARRPAKGENSYLTHELVVETNLLSDLELLDSGSAQDLEDELRQSYPGVDDVRFVPPGHYERPSSRNIRR